MKRIAHTLALLTALTAAAFGAIAPTTAQAAPAAPESAATVTVTEQGHKVYGPTPAPSAAVPWTSLDTPPPSCPNQNFCAYVNSGYRTDQGYETFPVRPAGTCNYTIHQNSISSLFNNSGRPVRVLKTTNCGGESVTVPNGEGWQQLTIDAPTFENRIKSIKFV
jgi:hypothetical protein